MNLIAGTTVLIEHKTSSSDIEDGSTFWKRLRLDSQASNYLVGAKAAGFEPTAVLYDVIRKPRIKPYTATPVEKREYTKPKDRACKECKKKNPAPGPHVEAVANDDGSSRDVQCVDGRIVTDPGGRLYANMREHDETPDEYRARLRLDIIENVESYFKRGIVVRSVSEEREAAHDAWDVAEQVSRSRLTGRWSRNVDACERYGRFCDHFAVCTGETSHDNPTRYRQTKDPHEELAGKHRLPLVTTSGMKCFRRCAREYFFSYEQGYRSIERADALAFGTLMHAGLEVWWKTVDLDAVMRELAQLAGPGGKQENQLHLLHAEELMRGYHARWCEESFDVLSVELEFAAPLVNPDTGTASSAWALGGKIDAIARVAA
jgi:hypothetical protein